MNPQSNILGEHQETKIFYCHGWGSHFDPTKGKIRSLARMGHVSGITVDYTLHPQTVFEDYTRVLKQRPQALIVGTSLGGFYAAWLGAELGLPFIAINPAVEPSKTLRAYLGRGVNHVGEHFELTESCVLAYEALSFRLDGCGTISVDLGDEILDAQATLNLVNGRLPVVAFEGGSHRFDHMEDLIERRPDLFNPQRTSKNT
ncbi:hypothetical protein IQ03_04791 [Gemmobacter caeni]|uniref:Esterase n=1 Tax=Gemmobacter caeni TaxID=589035 RepID=A0A2T6AJ98_9RHOB|nr:YqiA/YcfP family alpha/beta fold hydrolase [Gemmobacter caeni]PTX43874.1 hypothetical protein C8N34_1247 [Gemmobacter caeni]TWI93511.1 hypothetical protein IQ03_04791 [Gemmobacter caeni]